ncbi:MAG: hypothetical protein RBS39_00225 [Phycisphaerales bacterium]|nr:hypothetical protein [Phycisphaerales bacterium]
MLPTAVVPVPRHGRISTAIHVLLFPLIAWMIVNATWMSRLPGVDRRVEVGGCWTAGALVSAGLGGGLGGPLTKGCVSSPVIERADLPSAFFRDGARWDVIALHWLRYPLYTRAYGWGVVLLAVYGVLAALLSRAAVYPRARWGGPRFGAPSLWRESLHIGVRSSPVLFVCAGAFWPLVSLWGTAAYHTVAEIHAWPWIMDTLWTRAAIGVGLGLSAMWVSLVLGVRGLGRYRGRGEPGACGTCGYDVRSCGGRCSECGVDTTPDEGACEASLWVVPWIAPTRARRIGLACAFATLLAMLLAAPLVAGIAAALVQ